MTPEELNAKAELVAGLMEDGQHYDAAQEIPGIIAHASRLQAILDCEQGKRAPEGWTFNGMWNHSTGAQVWRVVARMKHDHGCAVFRWHLAFTEEEDGTPYPSALEALEAAEKRMVEEYPTRHEPKETP